MCSRFAEAQCCVCRRYLEQSSNRIIVEICGHQKCRTCFIKEEDGCSLCVRSNQKFSSQLPNHDVVASRSDSHNESGQSERTTETPLIVEINEDASHIITTNVTGHEVRYKCTICQKSFKSRNNRKYHLFCDKSRLRPFQCNQCQRRFITLAHLNYHQSTHNADKHFECKQCHKIYSGEIALKKHMRKHQNFFKYECSKCDEKFLYKEQLNIHQNRHNNVFHKCTECGKRFLIKSNLTKHIQSHSGLNRKMCPICKNSFSGSALKTHMLTHSKSKPHQCVKCAKKFIDQRTLERHWKTHFDNAFYECTLCSAKSGRKDNIRRHVRNLHSDSDEELRAILEKIFENFEKRKNMPNNNVIGVREKTKTEAAAMNCEKPDNKQSCAEDSRDVDISMEKPQTVQVLRNNATSVIKFVGRAQNVQQEDNICVKLNESIMENKNETVMDADIECQKDMAIAEEKQVEPKSTVNNISLVALDSIAEIGASFPSLEPLNYDPFPDIAPLPLINTNTNLTVYRQLLSPYLKKSTDTNNEASTSDKSNKSSKPKTATMVIDRPPKKMIEKYEIYRK